MGMATRFSFLEDSALRITILLIALSVTLAGTAQEEAQPQERTFGGDYDSLNPEQQRLIEDWIRRFNQVTGEDVGPEPFFDEFVKLSTKTTFDAVTHALMTTNLTDESGRPLGTALGLVKELETIRGKIKGARSDRQFRMYVVLKSDALETLKVCREFKRDADNTVFHKGYPINYRQTGEVKVPSIQISIAPEGDRADIDVDYRSSKFPAALFNGHLTAANSDVRAGNNHERHNSRWSGFADWWRGLFGFNFRRDYEDTIDDRTYHIPEFPRAGKKNIDVAVHDFLTSWLIEQKPGEAMAYISERAYPCVALNRFDDLASDRGMAPMHLLAGMRAVNEELGPQKSLEGLTLGVRLVDPSLKVVQQPHHAQFVLYSVPDDVVQTFDCAARTRLASETSVPARRKYGEYFGSVFHIKGPQGQGGTVALIWAKESGYWKIISYETEPNTKDETPDLRQVEAPPVPEQAREAADASFAKATRNFLHKWFIEKDYDAAFQAFSARCYSCYNLYRADDRPEARSPEEAARYLRQGLERTGELVGEWKRLDTLLVAIEPIHPLLRSMSHPDEATYALIASPDLVGEWADCARRAREEPFPEKIPLEYGNYYGLYFQFRTEGGEAPVLRLLWTKEGGDWKIVAYDIVVP